MSSQFSSTAVSSQSSTPAFLLTDDYLAADLSDLDDIDTLPPPLTVQPPHGSQQRAAGQQGGVEEEGGEDVDEDGVVRLPVDDETRAQLREIQGALSARLGSRPQPSHLSTAVTDLPAAHGRPIGAVGSSSTASQSSSHIPSHNVSTAVIGRGDHSSAASTFSLSSSSSASSSSASSSASASSPASVSSLLALLASKEADLRLAAQLGAALSEETETLQQYCRHLEQQIATTAHHNNHNHTPPTSHPHHNNHTTTPPHSNSPSPTHRTSHSLSSIATHASTPSAAEEAAHLRLELGRLERRMAVSEGWHRDALKVARKERREMEERLAELEKEGRRREAEEVVRRKRDEEERIRLTEEIDQLRAMEQQRLVRERELRRQREQKEKEDELSHQQTRDAKEQAEHLYHTEQRRREELERRCHTLQKQCDDATQAATLQAKEFEARRRRWEEERGRAVDDEVERHRSQAKALAEQYRAVEERVKQQTSSRRTLSVDTSGRLSPSPSPPSPLSAGGEDGRDRRAVLVSHSTQTPGEWMQLDRAESEMTIPKGRAENERVLYSPLHFTLLSPSSAVEDTAAVGKEQREEVKEAAMAGRGRAGRVEAAVEEELVIPLSLVTPPRQAVARSPYLSPHSPLPSVVEFTEADEQALMDVVAPAMPSAAAMLDSRGSAVHDVASSTVSFLSPLYPQQAGLSSSAAATVVHPTRPSGVTASQPVAPILAPPPPATPPRRSAVTSALASFLNSPLLTRPLFRSPQPTPPPSTAPPPPSTTSTATSSSPLLFTLHTAHPSSIRAHLTAASTSTPPLPPLLPLSSPFAQLHSSLVKRAGGVGGGRLQSCTDDATRRVFSVLMQTRMGEGVAGFG